MKWMFKHGKVIWNWGKDIHDYHERFYGVRSFNKRILSEHWEKYHADVNSYFSNRPDSLLTIELEKGFKSDEICSFLSIPTREIKHTQKNRRRNAKLINRIKYNTKYYYQLLKKI